ncbi:urease accessory protein [Pseudonocardia thermophila]|uniref:Urease accessory protein n=1 Tax=Pseudonocardia thermophila TaxID=1848 RepID=A0A1M6N6Y6_PSETH|nr:urease accessory UreF family protein [Pseudonocardia thermophila]SHJ91443.1 urease accessory protein [Pseudonocardia thermophila]
MNPELLVLADARLPSGGHGHSGGVEALATRGLLRASADLALFLHGRLRTGGETIAAAAAAACLLAGTGAPEWAPWDAAVDARTPSAALRTASRGQGAALLRTVARAWPGPAITALHALVRPHHPIVLGAAAAGASATAEDAAALALHHLTGGAATAAVRLLGLDPLAVAAVTAELARAARPIAASAAAAARTAVAAGDPALLPAGGSPLHDVLAQLQESAEVTLFAS